MKITLRNTLSPILKTVTIASLFILSDAAAICQERFSNVNIGFCYPISSNGAQAAEYTNHVSFNLLSGVSKEERSFSFAGISNEVKDKVTGFQFAGILNRVKNTAEGFQFAGISNLTGGTVKGFQFAGIYNSTANVEGFQFSGFLNRSKAIDGFQFAGFSNLLNGNADGFQFAGFNNIVRGNVDGFQFAGFSNIVTANTKGFQFAGFINNTKDVEGTQFGGFINIAKKVRGLQFAGFINIADSSDHSLALLNIIKKGEKNLAITTDEIQSTLVTFRSGGRVLYGVLGLGFNLKTGRDYMVVEGGFGAHLPLSNSFRINGEATGQYLEDWKSGYYYKTSLRLLPELKLGSRLAVLAGPSINFSETDTQVGMKLKNSDLWHEYSGNLKRQLFLGYTAGIQLSL